MNIFIAGLNYNMSEAELGELFAEYGEVVSVKIIMDRETGRSKGYGFVEMADDEAGDKAIAPIRYRHLSNHPEKDHLPQLLH